LAAWIKTKPDPEAQPQTLFVAAALKGLLTHKRPINSDDALFRKALQRFWKD
jgi:hypothetical protein